MALAWQSSLDWRAELRELDWRLVARCNETGDSRVLNILSQNLLHGGEDDWRRRCEYLLKMAQDNLQDLDVIDHCFASLTHNRPLDQSSSLTDLDYDALDFLTSAGIHEDVPWTKPYWVGTFLELIAKLDEGKYLDFVEKSFESEDTVKRIHIRILGAANAKRAFDRLLESGLKRSHIFRFIEWASRDNLLGEFAGSILSKQLKISDPNVAVQLERLYVAGAYEDLARVLQHFEVGEDWLLEVDRILVEVDRSRPAIFERIEEILSASYWAGMTSRIPGSPTPRDKAVVDFAERRLSDNSLSPRLRQYYSARRDAAAASIENDLAGDERLVGRAL